jgi:hypothetical protein
MVRRLISAAVVLVTAVATVGCAAAAPSPSAQGATLPGVSTERTIGSSEEYYVVACKAWDALDRAVGDPDTGEGSKLSRALDQAVEARDVASADRAAAGITAELASGRRQLKTAGTWGPRSKTVAQFDRVFVAFEAMTAAKRAAARGKPNAVDPQAAFEQAGGVEAWFAMFESIPPSEMATGKPCPNVPVTP